MTIAGYATDLSAFKDFEAATTLGEMAGYVNTGAPALDTDYPIQGSQHVSAAMTKTGLGSIMADFGGNVSWTSGHVFLMWGVFLAAASVNTFALGGLRFLLGTDITTNYKGWKVGGRDFGRYPYGGWQNFAVDPETTADYTGGTLAGYRWAGIGVDCTAAIGKGVPVGLDCIRYGRGQLSVIDGDATAYGTFGGMASANDALAARWGLFQDQSGSYIWKGLMSLGMTATAVDFRDSNATIVVADTQKVTSGFNRIEISHASSRVDWTNVSITALGTVSRGNFECVANADVNKDTCVFTDMGTFIYQAGSTILNTTYRRTDKITAGGATLTGCTIDSNRATTALLWDVATNPNGKLDNTQFISGGAGHAIEFGPNTPATIALFGVGFSGYGAGASTDAAIYNNSGHAIEISILGGGDVPTVRNGAGASTDVVTGQRNFGFTVEDAAGDPVTGYEWRLYDASAADPGELGTELDGEESATQSQQNYAYTYAVDTAVVVQVMHADFIEATVRSTLIDADRDVAIVLQPEENT